MISKELLQKKLRKYQYKYNNPSNDQNRSLYKNKINRYSKHLLHIGGQEEMPVETKTKEISVKTETETKEIPIKGEILIKTETKETQSSVGPFVEFTYVSRLIDALKNYTNDSNNDNGYLSIVNSVIMLTWNEPNRTEQTINTYFYDDSRYKISIEYKLFTEPMTENLTIRQIEVPGKESILYEGIKKHQKQLDFTTILSGITIDSNRLRELNKNNDSMMEERQKNIMKIFELIKNR